MNYFATSLSGCDTVSVEIATAVVLVSHVVADAVWKRQVRNRKMTGLSSWDIGVFVFQNG